MLVICYLRKGTIYVPTAARTEAGFYLIVEPVSAVDVNDANALRRALKEAIARGNPTIPTPPRNNYPEPVMPKYAGVRSLRAFERGTRLWHIRSHARFAEGAYQIVGQRHEPNGSWFDDPEQTITFPLGTNIELVIDRLIAILTAATSAED